MNTESEQEAKSVSGSMDEHKSALTGKNFCTRKPCRQTAGTRATDNPVHAPDKMLSKGPPSTSFKG